MRSGGKGNGIQAETLGKGVLPAFGGGEKQLPVRGVTKNLLLVLLIVAGYLSIYLIGRMIWCDLFQAGLAEWLFSARPTGKDSYLYGWLLSSNMFWYAMAVSAVPALFGRYKFSLLTLIGFVIGLVAGIVFGPYPKGATQGHDHYGWAIWGVAYLISMVVGIVVEKYKKSKMGTDTVTKKEGGI